MLEHKCEGEGYKSLGRMSTTSNNEHSTPNIECRRPSAVAQHSAFRVRFSLFGVFDSFQLPQIRDQCRLWKANKRRKDIRGVSFTLWSQRTNPSGVSRFT